ncbi:MAG: YceI family protein [Candidatus Berkiella sp.]
MRIRTSLLAAPLFFLPMLAFAEVAKWEIVPIESNLRFTATQNNAPVSGTFKNINGSIDFSKDDLKHSKVNIVVEMDSVHAGFQELVSTLKTADWLDVAKFKEATFTSDDITNVKGDTYLAKGQLKIRDKKVPIQVTFDIKDTPKGNMQVQGETEIKRTEFGVGQGDWAGTDEVKDEVKVNFNLELKPSK